MSYEMLVGLNVLDDQMYQEYRKAIKPMISEYGGGFGYDFKVSEVLLPEASSDINRVFTIYFRDRKAMDEFFSNPEYIKIKAQYFQNSVGNSTVISSYEKTT